MKLYFSSKLTPEAIQKAPMARNMTFYDDLLTAQQSAEAGAYIYDMEIAMIGQMQTQFVPEINALAKAAEQE